MKTVIHKQVPTQPQPSPVHKPLHPIKQYQKQSNNRKDQRDPCLAPSHISFYPCPETKPGKHQCQHGEYHGEYGQQSLVG